MLTIPLVRCAGVAALLLACRGPTPSSSGQAMPAVGGAGQASVCPFGGAQVPLWPGVAPGSEGSALSEAFTERSKVANVHDRSVTGVSTPSLYPYAAQPPNGAVAIVMPGGGYTHLAWDKEGLDIAVWLNMQGVTAFVLKYRMPADFPQARWAALADAQRAIRLVRHNAAACGFDTARIGVIGFSAGGHLASQLVTRPTAVTAPAIDAIDAVDARPSFSVLMYPVISMDPSLAHSGSKVALLGAKPSAADIALASSELQVTATTPPTFLGVSNNDTAVKPENTQRFADALQAKGIAHQLHRYQDGAHGTGIRDASGDMAAWPTQCATWLAARGR